MNRSSVAFLPPEKEKRQGTSYGHYDNGTMTKRFRRRGATSMPTWHSACNETHKPIDTIRRRIAPLMKKEGIKKENDRKEP